MDWDTEPLGAQRKIASELVTQTDAGKIKHSL